MADLHWPPVDEEALQPLPPVLRAMVKALGFGRASVFLHQYGGIPFTLPKLKDSKMGLMPDELERLRVTLKPHLDADNRVALPKADKLLAYVRDMEIAKNKDNQSIVQQARQYHLTTRHVLNIRAQHKCHDKDPARYKRTLSLTKAEIEALLRLTYQAAATEGGNVYANLVHKLDKVNAQIDSFPAAQFDLF